MKIRINKHILENNFVVVNLHINEEDSTKLVANSNTGEKKNASTLLDEFKEKNNIKEDSLANKYITNIFNILTLNNKTADSTTGENEIHATGNIEALLGTETPATDAAAAALSAAGSVNPPASTKQSTQNTGDEVLGNSALLKNSNKIINN